MTGALTTSTKELKELLGSYQYPCPQGNLLRKFVTVTTRLAAC